jgi:cytochrome P450
VIAPEIPGLPLVGNALGYGRGQLDWLTAAARRGPCVRIRFFHQPYLLVNEPALIEEALVTKGKLFKKDIFARGLKPVLGEGLLTSEGDEWRRRRRLINPFFTRERIDAYVPLMRRAVEHALQPGDVELHAFATKLTLDIVLSTLFGGVPIDARRIGEPLAALMEWYTQPLPLLFPSLARLPLPANRRFERAIADIDVVLRELMDKRVGMAGALRDAGLNDREVRDELATFLLAGHETTASALTFAMWRLGRHPQFQKVETVDRVLRESMRLHPPVWSMGREASEDCTLGEYEVRRGSQLWFLQWAVHRDPRFYEDPEVFLPDRWLTPAATRGAYFPFGFGARQCVGMHFAMVEATTVLSTLAERMTIEAHDERLDVVPAVTLRPRGSVRATLRLR